MCMVKGNHTKLSKLSYPMCDLESESQNGCVEYMFLSLTVVLDDMVTALVSPYEIYSLF